MPRTIEAVQPVQGGTYIDGDERDAYVDRPMKLLGVQREGSARYGPRWVVEAVMLDSGEKVLIALAANATRDTMFGQVRDDLAADGADAYAPVCLYRKSREGGNAFWTFRTATSNELEAAAEAEAIEAETGSDDPGERDDEAAEAAGKRGKDHK